MLSRGRLSLLQGHVSLALMRTHLTIDCELGRRTWVYVGNIEHCLPANNSKNQILGYQMSFWCYRVDVAIFNQIKNNTINASIVICCYTQCDCFPDFSKTGCPMFLLPFFGYQNSWKYFFGLRLDLTADPVVIPLETVVGTWAQDVTWKWQNWWQFKSLFWDRRDCL